MSAFVRPTKVRLFLADVSRRAHQALLARKKPKPTASEVGLSAARVAEAEALNYWIDVKQLLNTGEQRARFGRGHMKDPIDGEWKPNPIEAGMALVTAYLLNWSLTDDEGHVVEIAGLTPDSIAAVLDNLKPEDFGDIRQAIEYHEHEQILQSIEAKKKILVGATASKAISGSPPDAAGESIGSVN